MPGQDRRIQFGDGDFFDLAPRAAEEPRLIEFDWRFLGVGPTARIRWATRAVAGATEVTVCDHQADRTPAVAHELLAGWTDFFARLARHLATGETSRYGHRDQIDGSVTLPGRGRELLSAKRVHQWLPIATDGFVPRWFFVVDDEGPRRFRLGDWQSVDGRVTFAVEIPDASAPTSCAVRVEPLARGWRLSFTHAGWGGLGLSERRARVLRSRFTAAWVAALQHARELSGQE